MNYKHYIALFLIVTSLMHAGDDMKKKIKQSTNKETNRLSKGYSQLTREQVMALLTYNFDTVHNQTCAMNENLIAMNESLIEICNTFTLKMAEINSEVQKTYGELNSIALKIHGLMSSSTTEEGSGSNSNNQNQPEVIDDIESLRLAKSSSNRSQETFDSKKLLRLKKYQSDVHTHDNPRFNDRVKEVKEIISSAKKGSYKKHESKEIKIEVTNTDDDGMKKKRKKKGDA